MTMNASGIRDISRVLAISTNTVLAVIRQAAQSTREPIAPPRIADLEMDEFWSFVQHKKQQRWTWLAFDRQRKQLTAFVNGRRTDKSCGGLLHKLGNSRVTRFHTDKWESYLKLLPAKRHLIGKEGTRNIERRNLNFRDAYQATSATNNLFFKERRNARCRYQDLTSSIQIMHSIIFETRPGAEVF